MIQVSRTRFFEIFADNKYISQIQKGPWEYSSCPYYDVVDTETNIIVGVYSDGSWENTFEVLPIYASKNDIIEHYEKLLKHKNDQLERTRKSWRELHDYKNLSVEDRALQDKKEEEEREWRKTHPGLFTMIEDTNIIKYNPYETTPEKVKTQKYIIKGMIKLFKDLSIFYKEKQELERLRVLNNKDKGYYINGIFYAPANPINNDIL